MLVRQCKCLKLPVTLPAYPGATLLIPSPVRTELQTLSLTQGQKYEHLTQKINLFNESKTEAKMKSEIPMEWE